MADRGEAPPPAEKSGFQRQQRYLNENYSYIRALVLKHLEYPVRAKRMRWSGRVVLSFAIRSDGGVAELKVAGSSGIPVLDRCAREAVLNAAPFPAPPTPAEVVLPVNFELK